MRIAMVSPLTERVPPLLYGGTERVVSYLTEELVARGHDVTLFASGDSVTTADLSSVVEQSLRLTDRRHDPLLCHCLMLEHVYKRAHEFDVLHFNLDFLHFSSASRLATPNVTTMHGRLDLLDAPALAQCFPTLPLVSISNSQRTPLPDANWVGTVYHGLPRHQFTFHPKPGNYLAFLGRIAPEKRPDRAIMIARKSGMPLKIAAKVDRVDTEYFEDRIKPLLKGTDVEFVGEISERDKNEFLGNARALLFPIDWPEPFGLVMIEAMACGTPVIAYRRGSVPEIIDEGRSGYIVENETQATAAALNIDRIDRQQCRAAFERRFTAEQMAARYVEIYNALGAATSDARLAGSGISLPECR